MFEYNLEHLLSFTVKITEPEVIGPVGGDWLTIRKDGVAILDVRATIETHDEALISLSYWGILDMGDNGYEAFLQGRPPASGTAIRMSARLSASHPGYLWLNRLHC